jgi:ABC-type transport system involved in cytochrome c biogenesis permease component
MNKVLALQAALRCLTCGLLALIPVIGLPFAIAAMIFHVQASGHAPDDWHIARRYALLGMLFAALGLVLNVTAIVWFGIAWVQKEM